MFEENYRLLQRLLPEMEAGGDRYLLAADDGEPELEVLILERCRYTTVVHLHKPFAVDGEWFPHLSFELRVYHDARVVEVSAYQGCRRIPARYQVDEYGRYHRDEKRQSNLLLHDLLMHCLRHGYRELSEQV